MSYAALDHLNISSGTRLHGNFYLQPPNNVTYSLAVGWRHRHPGSALQLRAWKRPRDCKRTFQYENILVRLIVFRSRTHRVCKVKTRIWSFRTVLLPVLSWRKPVGLLILSPAPAATHITVLLHPTAPPVHPRVVPPSLVPRPSSLGPSVHRPFSTAPPLSHWKS